MNEANLALAEGLLSPKYVKQAMEARRRRDGMVKSLLSQRQLPDEGWDDASIELFVRDLSLMDSNNFVDNVGLGEREGRIFSPMVAKRHFGMAHGVGRSGDLTAEQPKAAGSSLMSKIAHFLALHALRIAGLREASSCVILPLATGMAITSSLLALRTLRPGATKVVWPRIDQKTCLKAIVSAGLTPVVIENQLEGDELRTDLAAVEAAVAEDPASILCVISTTSCFAPRVPERVVEVADVCKRFNIPHLVNNAYGTQCSKTMDHLSSACRKGRVDGIIQSTDKNFLVPVGGSILAVVGKDPAKYGDTDLVSLVSKLYPGRASNTVVLDLFITLLSMGKNGYKKLLQERESFFAHMLYAAKNVAANHGERVLNTKRNGISVGITLDTFARGHEEGKAVLSHLGGMLFSRCCSGTRVVTCVKRETVANITFESYGAHSNDYPHPYLTFACALGTTKEDIDTFMKRLDTTLKEMRKKFAPSGAPAWLQPDPPSFTTTTMREAQSEDKLPRAGSAGSPITELSPNSSPLAF